MSTDHEPAPAKINLSLHILGRRSDGYHELESLVVFADLGDDLALTPGPLLSLSVHGATAAATGPTEDNLVSKAARALATAVPGLIVGRFHLTKRLPVAAGLGGGSADAAAALRLLARSNGLAIDDPRLAAAAGATGADCLVCLRSRPAIMRGIGERTTPLDGWPDLHAVLVNPGVAVPTRAVFEAMALPAGVIDRERAMPALTGDPAALLAATRNDLEPTARAFAPEIGDTLAALQSAGASLVRMSGSGPTVFGLFPDAPKAAAAANAVAGAHRSWWVRAVVLVGSRG